MNIKSRNAQGTDVGGFIIMDTTWNLAGSPYIVVFDIWVEVGVTLTIEPGVEVRFNEHRSIYVNGTLMAVGTKNERITITSNKASPSPGEWNRIQINSIGHTEIKYCEISYGTSSIYLESSSINNIANNNFLLNRDYSIYLDSSIGNYIANNTMIDNGIVIWGDLLEHWNTHYIDKNNTVNGKSVIYWKNQTGGVIPSGAGQVILANCTNVKIENQKLTYGSVGIELGFSSNNHIIGNDASSNNDYGIYLYNSSGNNISNNKAANNNYGIYLHYSSGNNIFDNDATNNDFGIYLYYSNGNNISNNIAANNDFGIYLNNSSGNYIINGTTSNNEYGIFLDYCSSNSIADNTMIEDGISINGPALTYWNTHSIDTSNTVNGKPVIYWKNQTGGTIPPNAGQVILANCTDVRIDYQEPTHGSVGIELGFSSHNYIIGNNASSNNLYGIYLYHSDKNNILCNFASYNYNGIYISYSTGNNITGNEASNNRNSGIALHRSDKNNILDNIALTNNYGIHLIYSKENIISCNDVLNNSDSIMNDGYGICLYYSSGNNIGDNIVFNNGYGIIIDCSSAITIMDNYISTDFENQWGAGIHLFQSTDVNITENNISKSAEGIYIQESTNITVTANDIFSNNGEGIRIWQSSNITITYNNIWDNGIGIRIFSLSTNVLVHHNNFIDNELQAIDWGSNQWDNGYPSGGNYWSNLDEPSEGAYDDYKGEDQLSPGSDGIVDLGLPSGGKNPYDIDADSKDNYPLIRPLPDLEVENSDIAFVPSSPVINGTSILINATIHNVGFGRARNIIIRFYDGNPSEPGSFQIGNDEFLSSIDGRSNRTIGIQWTADPIGIHDIYVVVDPDNTIEECSEANNIAFKGLLVTDIPPPTLYIEAVGDDIILNWTQPTTEGLSHYLLYRSTSQTDFDFSDVWIDTSQHNDSGIIPLRTTWNDTQAASEIAHKEFYYTIRTVYTTGEISSTSRTVGKWTKTFPKGVSTFSLPLKPIRSIDTYTLINDMGADYIKWMDTKAHVWRQHNLGDPISINNTIMILGEGYEVKFDSKVTYTFCGMPAAMICYDNDSGFSGFNHTNEAISLFVSIQPNGDVQLIWQEPISMDIGDWSNVYYSNTRDGFFGIFGLDYFLVSHVNYGTYSTRHINAQANAPGARLYYMVVPFNASGIRGSSTYSIGIWTEEYLSGYDTFGKPLKPISNHTADWYCNIIPNTVGINFFNISSQSWRWRSTRMPKGAYDPVLEMTEGYQISTSVATKYAFIGI